MKTVLIVDDNKEDLRTLKALLESQGYKVTSATNGVEALKAARKSPPDVTLSDILMPVMDGFEFIAQVRKKLEYAEVPVIFVTSHQEESSQELAFQLGARGYIVKDESFCEAIMESVERVLG